MVKIAEILSRYGLIPLYVLNYHGLEPSSEESFGGHIESMKIPSNLTSQSAGKLAGIVSQISPNLRLVILIQNLYPAPHNPFERGSDDADSVGSIRFIGFIGYRIA